MICKWCKEETPEGSLFCEHCGKLLGHDGGDSPDGVDAPMADVDSHRADATDTPAPDSAVETASDSEMSAQIVADEPLEDARPSAERPSALAAWVKMAEEEYEAEHTGEASADGEQEDGRHDTLQDSGPSDAIEATVAADAADVSDDSQSDEDYSNEFVDIDDAVHTEDGWAAVAFGDVDAMPVPDDDEFFVDDPAWPEQPQLGKARIAVIAVISTLFAAAMILLFCVVMIRVLGL